MRFPHLVFLSTLSLIGISACSDQSSPSQEETANSTRAAVESFLPAQALEEETLLVEAFRSGDLNASEFLDRMAAFATHPDPDVVIGSTQQLDFIYDEFPDLHRGLARHVTRTYGRVYRTARAADTDDAKAISAGLGGIMAREGNDQEARNYLIRQGSLYLELDPTREDLKPTVPLHLLESAFVQTLRARPDIAFEPLLTLVGEGEVSEASDALQALAASSDPDLIDQLFNVPFLASHGFSGEQIDTLFSELWTHPLGRDRTWEFLKANLEGSEGAQGETMLLDIVPLIASQFCSAERQGEVLALFQSHGSNLPEQTETMESILVDIQDCIEFRQTQGPSLIAALSQ